ncbi:glycosyltransferase family 4 protein [Corynebacterium casei]|uniref:glycosyltransferase family 4 protein n=1 Tax=Corynebacterium casei TaxID=160386 RepID=UPI003FD663A2
MPKGSIKALVEVFFQVGNQVLSDPASVAKKIDRKLGIRRISKVLRILAESTERSEARCYLDAGQYSRVATARTRGIWQKVERRILMRTAQDQLILLNADIYSSVSRMEAPETEKPLFVLTSSLPFTQSGYSVRSHKLLKALMDGGVIVSAVTRFGYPASIGALPVSKISEVEGVKYIQNSCWRSPRSVTKQIEIAVKGLVRIARSEQATVLHTTTDFKNAVVVSRAARILGIPWVYEIRGEIEKTWLTRQAANMQEVARESEYFRLSEKQEAQAREAASAVFVISDQIRMRLIDEGTRPEKLFLLPNGVDQIDFDSGPRKNRREEVSEFEKAELIVGTITAVVDYEGLEYLVHAMIQLPSIVHCLIVGDGEAKSSLENLAVDLGVDDRVHFVGRKPPAEIDEWYSTLDVFVVPRKDTDIGRSVTPIKPMQAQAMGIPVITSDLPALREVTGGFASYVRPEDSAALAEAIEKFLKEKDTDSIDLKAVASWLQGRTWESNADRILTIYRHLPSKS